MIRPKITKKQDDQWLFEIFVDEKIVVSGKTKTRQRCVRLCNAVITEITGGAMI